MSKHTEDEAHKILFSVRRSVRYHTHRRRFFDRFSKVTDALSAISGSAAVASAIAKSQAATIYFSAFTAIFSAINLVFGLSNASRMHHDLAREFIALEKEIVSIEPTDTIIKEWKARRLDIEAEEPPPMTVLNLMCHNELLKAMGYEDDDLLQIHIVQRILSPFIDLCPSAIKKRSTESLIS